MDVSRWEFKFLNICECVHAHLLFNEIDEKFSLRIVEKIRVFVSHSDFCSESIQCIPCV